MSTPAVAQPPSRRESGVFPSGAVEHVDVLIVGAGLSGIGAACHLRDKLPGQDLRDPRGARRDRRHLGPVPLSRHPLGLRHVHAGLLVPAVEGREGDRRRPGDPAVRPRHRARARRRERRSASTTGSCAPSGRLRERALDGRGRAHRHRRDGAPDLRFLFICTGYYRYDEGFTPDFEGTERFAGRIVHPQHWPEDLDYTGKRVVVIGSGATAVTLVPAMAEHAAHVTMLQRSPSYVVSLPAADPIADVLRRVLPAKVAYPIVRWKNVLLTTVFFHLSRRAPR